AGMGHTEGITVSTLLTEQQVAEYFVKDVARAERFVKKQITKKPNQAEYDMMVSFVFNLGAGNFQTSTLLRKFNQGDNQGACQQYPRWVYVNGKDCRV
ncbi:lysozyme, partial [Vibrio anguillarum]